VRIVRSLDAYKASADLLLSIGVFDGVHLGHRAVLSKLVGLRTTNSIAGAFTFERHPQAYLQPGQAPPSLTTLDEKINLLAACDLDVLFLLPFDERIAEIPAEKFLTDVLCDTLRTRALIVGSEWRFGKGRGGDVALAERVLRARGCSFEAAPLLERDGEKISSSRIRGLIAERKFEQAEALLGSPYRVRGIVALGDGRGHELGFPTANLQIAEDKLIPPSGVYATTAARAGKAYQSVTSIGRKATFGDDHELTVETYLLNFSGTIYGEQLSLTGWRFLREQQRFASAGELVAQMHRDVSHAAALT
jgi:riboflavin kinase/FMN adenylyltransferase